MITRIQEFSYEMTSTENLKKKKNIYVHNNFSGRESSSNEMNTVKDNKV